jgi:hypothetical protein
VLVAHALILATWEDLISRPAQANSSWDPISKITRDKWTGGVAQHYSACVTSTKPWVWTPVNQRRRRRKIWQRGSLRKDYRKQKQNPTITELVNISYTQTRHLWKWLWTFTSQLKPRIPSPSVGSEQDALHTQWNLQPQICSTEPHSMPWTVHQQLK